MKVNVEKGGHRIVVDEIGDKVSLNCLLGEIELTCRFLDIWMNLEVD